MFHVKNVRINLKCKGNINYKFNHLLVQNYMPLGATIIRYDP